LSRQLRDPRNLYEKMHPAFLVHQRLEALYPDHQGLAFHRLRHLLVRVLRLKRILYRRPLELMAE
jgi:hypothetical protein